MRNVSDILNDLEKENKLIDVNYKCTAFQQEARNITNALNAIGSDENQGFRLEYCGIKAADNNTVSYYKFTIYSWESVYKFQRNLIEMSTAEKRNAHCQVEAVFCIRESDLSENEIKLLNVIAKPEDYYITNVESFRYKEKHLKLFEYMEYMMALSLVKCLEKAELAKVEIVNLKNEIYRKKEEIDEEVLGEK